MQTGSTGLSGVIQFGTFYLDGQLFGVDILKMREILLPQDMTRVPRAGQEMEGVINLRGLVIPVVSLRARLGIPGVRTTSGRGSSIWRSTAWWWASSWIPSAMCTATP